MITSVFSVHDSKAGAFCTPYYSENNNTAIRDFAYAANDKDSQIGRHPSDYTLFCIGSFDNQTGQLTTIEPIAIALALTLVKTAEVA
nr:MAG: nonstructural protein [Microvirus sp.]